MDKENIFYYQKELDYLHKSKETILEFYPKLAPFLDKNSKDPDVERIIENLAILTSKIHKELDENIPYIAQSLINILSPNYTNSLPSLCLQEFAFEKNAKENKILIPKSSILKSKPVDKIECEFKTTYDVYLYPLEIEEVFLNNEKKYHSMDIKLKINKENTKLSDLNLERINLYLGDEVYVSTTLLLYIHLYLQELSIILENNEEIKLNPYYIKTMGFNSNESVIKYNDLGFEAFSLLREYFFIPQKFNFIGIENLNILNNISDLSFTLRFKFLKALPKECIPKAHMFSLAVSPIINIFEKSAEPIINNHTKDAYKIFIDRTHEDAYELIEVIQVKAHSNIGEVKILKNYNSFERFSLQNKDNFYYISSKSDSKNNSFKEISFFTDNENFIETISINALCSNKNLPLKLKIADINHLKDFKNIKTKNITLASALREVKVDGSLLYKLVALLSFNYQSLLSKDSFLAILNTYSFMDDKENKSICELLEKAIINIKAKTIYSSYHLNKRGTLCIIDIDDSCFYSLGDVYRLGLVLSRFFGSFTSINSFFKLKIKCLKSEDIFTYPIVSGNKELM